MKSGIVKWLNKKFPQNYIVEKPFIGAAILLVLTFAFMVLYKPFSVHAARSFSIGLTLGMYSFIMVVFAIGAAFLLKIIPYFAKADEWNILKELLSILIILSAMGIAVYFAGFLIEVPAARWNIRTFLNSYTIAFLVGIIPFAFFTLINYRYIIYGDVIEYYNQLNSQQGQEQPEELLMIASKLKKEEVHFYPGQFIYAESEGNYVVFHLIVDDKIKTKMVRNSITNIEQQLSSIPYFIRTHRAFIVNLKRVQSKKGNTLGYRVKLTGIDDEIPVSRNNTHDFDRIIKKFS
jgi:hypothetical protein